MGVFRGPRDRGHRNDSECELNFSDWARLERGLTTFLAIVMGLK